MTLGNNDKFHLEGASGGCSYIAFNNYNYNTNSYVEKDSAFNVKEREVDLSNVTVWANRQA